MRRIGRKLLSKSAPKRTLLFLFAFLFSFSPLASLVGLPAADQPVAAVSCGDGGGGGGSSHSGPRPGAVALDQAANFLADMSDITGAYYDWELDRIVFVGKSETAAPKFDKDDLAVAIKSLVFNDTIPRMGMWHTSNPAIYDVTYDGGIENTRFGKMLFDADYALKQYLMGYRPNGQQITSISPTYRSYVHRYVDRGINQNAPQSGGSFTISPEYVNLKLDWFENAFVFDDAGMQVTYEPWGPNDPNADAISYEFAAEQTQNYDLYAQETPSYGEAKRLAKMVSVVKWIRDMGIATDFEWAREYTPEFVATPTTAPTYQNPPYNGWTFTGGLQYDTANSYESDNGDSAELKEASQQESTAKEDLHWTFEKDGQEFESVAVAADAFRSMGGYSTASTDLSGQAAPNSKIELTRTYSSYRSTQKGIGRGWDIMPARLTDIGGGTMISCDDVNWTNFPIQITFQTAEGQYEKFVYDCNQGFISEDGTTHTKLERYEASGETTGYMVQTKDLRQYHFDANMVLTHIRDRNSNDVSYHYDSGGRLTSIRAETVTTAPLRDLDISYNSSGRISSVQDWTGRTVSYGYDSKGNLITVTDPKGGITQYTYDANNKLATTTDRRGKLVTTNTYNDEAKVVTKTDVTNNTRSYAYNNDTRTITETDDNNRTFTTKYDDKSRVTEETDALGKKVEFTWGSDLHTPTKIKDERGLETNYNVESVTGNVLSITYPDNKTVAYEYDTKNRMKKITDGRYGTNPKVTTLTYDAVDNNIVQKNEAGLITQYTYTYSAGSWRGRLATQTDPSGRTTEWTSDIFGNKLTEKNPQNQIKTFAYDGAGRLTAETDAAGKSKTYTYDNNNNLLTTTDAAGTTTNVYNPENKLTSITTANNTVTELAYTDKGEHASTEDAMSNLTDYSYDDYSNMTARQDALNHTTQYVYDAMNRRTQTTTPLGKVAKWEYDGNGNIVKRIDESNRETTYEYDSLNRLTKTIYPNTSVATQAYDNRGNLTSITTPQGNSSYQYDIHDRLTSETDLHNNTIEYTYDNAGNTTQIKYPDNKLVNYAFDTANRLESVTDWNNQETEYQYHANGSLATKQLPNGVTASYTYDNANRLAELEYNRGQQLLTRFSYERNSVGNVIKETEENGFSAPVVPPSTYVVYDEQLRSGWSDGWSWSSSINLNATGNAQTGAKAISWQPNSAWAGLHLRSTSGTFDTSPYNAISFALKSSQPGQRAMMSLKDPNDNDLAQVDVTMYGGEVSSTGYKVYTVPLAAINADDRDILGITITDGSNGAQPAFHVDNIHFTTAKANDTTIYENELQQGMENWSWGTNNYLTDPGDPYSGSHAITTTYNDPWGALALQNWNGFSTKGYTHLSLAIKSTTNDQPLSIQFAEQLGEGVGNELNLDAYGGYPNSAGYKVYNIPIQDLGMVNQKVHGIRLQEEAGAVPRTIKVDAIKLTAGEPAPAGLIYGDSLRNGWSNDWSWDSNINMAQTTHVQAGTHAVQWQPYTAWGGLHLRKTSGLFDTAPYNALRFSMKATQAGQKVHLTLKDANDEDIRQLDISMYGGNLSASNYKTYTVPLSALDGENRQILGVNFMDNTGAPQQNLYLDELSFVSATPNPLIIYDDALTADFDPWVWNSVTVNPADTTSPHTGSSALGVTFGGSWGGTALYHWEGLHTDDYQSLSFALKGSQANQNFTVQMLDQAGDGIGDEIPIANYGGAPSTSAYKVYNIPLSDLDSVNQKVYGMLIQDQLGTPQAKILMDDIKLLPASSAPSGPQETNYTYDPLGRLLTALYPDRTYSYTYNAVGNRLTSNENGSASTYSYNDDNQMTAKTGRTFTYDNQGNQVTDNTKTLTYDFDNKLTAWNDPVASTALGYSYDGAGNRVQKTANGITHQYVTSTVNELSHVLVDKNTTANTQSFLVYGDQLLAQGGGAANDRQYFITDGLGNTRYIADNTGETVQAYAYDPYGSEVVPAQVASHTFQLQEKDHENKLVYLRARYYDPTTGRFTSRDPVEGTLNDPQTQNGYSYVSNNPVNFTDPSGKFLETIWDIGNIGYDIATCNWGSLAWDVGAALVPFVPAGGTKALKYADDAYDAAKQFKRLSSGEIQALKRAGYDIHDLKSSMSGVDIFKNEKGDLFLKPLNGSGPGEPLNININRIK